LVDVWVKQGTDLAHLEETLRHHVPTFVPVMRTPGSLVDTSFVASLGAGAFEPWVVCALVSAGVLSLLICGGVVAFGVHMAVRLHRGVLETLNLMGASSSYIARQFHKQTFTNTLKGIGICLGLSLLLLGPVAGVGLYNGWPMTWSVAIAGVGAGGVGVGLSIGLGFFAVVLLLTRWITTWVVYRSLGRSAS
jgi:cell division protein FtsX